MAECDEDFEIPKHWYLSEYEEYVIGTLIDRAGDYVPAEELYLELYSETVKGPAPAKLRVLIQRCRQALREISLGTVGIETRKKKGWRITKDGAYKLSLM